MATASASAASDAGLRRGRRARGRHRARSRSRHGGRQVIGHLRGTLLERSGSAVIVDCGGVGYEVTLSGHSLGQIGAPGAPLSLRVFTHAQESRIALYGFTSSEERELFDLLITVKNVGPASATKILSAGAGPADIAGLIARGQTRALQALRGVGKKTAELLVVELREKCQELLQAWGDGGSAAVESAGLAEPDPYAGLRGV